MAIPTTRSKLYVTARIDKRHHLQMFTLLSYHSQISEVALVHPTLAAAQQATSVDSQVVRLEVVVAAETGEEALTEVAAEEIRT